MAPRVKEEKSGRIDLSAKEAKYPKSMRYESIVTVFGHVLAVGGLSPRFEQLGTGGFILRPNPACIMCIDWLPLA